VRHPALVPLYDRARVAVKAIPGGVRFEWVPRHLNARADHLASGREGEPPAPPQTLTYAASPVRDVAAPLAGRIAALNAKGSAGLKEYLTLRVGGKDRCSLMPWGELAAAAGPECVRAAAEAFPDDQRSQLAALRWALRGLAVQHAIKKVRADQQVLAARGGQT
jgi:hypothetical protein